MVGTRHTSVIAPRAKTETLSSTSQTSVVSESERGSAGLLTSAEPKPKKLRYIGRRMRRTPEVITMGRGILGAAHILRQSEWLKLYRGATVQRNQDPALVYMSAAAFEQAITPGGDERRNRIFNREPVNPVLAQSTGDLAMRQAVVVDTARSEEPSANEPLELRLGKFAWRSYKPTPELTTHQLLMLVEDPDGIVASEQARVGELGYTRDVSDEAGSVPHEQPATIVLNITMPGDVPLPEVVATSIEEYLSSSMPQGPVTFEPVAPVFADR